MKGGGVSSMIRMFEGTNKKKKNNKNKQKSPAMRHVIANPRRHTRRVLGNRKRKNQTPVQMRKKSYVFHHPVERMRSGKKPSSVKKPQKKKKTIQSRIRDLQKKVKNKNDVIKLRNNASILNKRKKNNYIDYKPKFK